MNKLKPVLDVIKSNWVSVLCGVIALAALIALYVPTGGMYADLADKLAKREKVAKDMRALIGKPRTLPIVSPDSDTPDPLAVFPDQDVINRGTEAVTAVHTEAVNMLNAAVESNRHLPLLPGSLPAPDQQTQYNFAKTYVSATADDPANARPIDPRSGALPHAVIYTIVRGGMRPTQEEIDRARAEKKVQIDKERIIEIQTPNGPQEEPASRKDADDQFAIESAKIPQQKQFETAKRISCYLEPGSLPWDKTISTTFTQGPPSADQIWDAQATLWCIQDLATGVAQANAVDPKGDPLSAPPDVTAAAVKQIERADKPQYIVSGVPTDLTAGVDQALPKVPAVSMTGRVTNGVYDVLRFNATLIVDARRLTQVIQKLQQGRFMTVTALQIVPVDPAQALANGYAFGDAPCLRVTFEVEELMMNQWVKDLMPPTFRTALGTRPASVPGAPSATDLTGMPANTGGPRFGGFGR